MFAWLSENAATLIVGAIVATALIAVLVKLARDRVRGRGACGGCSACSGCASCSGCAGCGRDPSERKKGPDEPGA